MDSNQKPLPSPPPPPPPPPKNGNRGRPPLVSMQLHDEEDGGAIGVGDMEAAALRRGSPRASCHELSRSGCHELSGSSHHELSESGHRLEDEASSCVETKMPPISLVGCPGSAEATAERCGLPPRRSREVARLRLPGLGTVAAVDDRPYACNDCSMTFGRETTLGGHMRSHKRDHLSSDSEEDAPTPKRRKKRKSKLTTVKPLEVTWGNHARRNGSPRDAPAEVKVSGSESNNVTVANIAVAMHNSNNVAENDRISNGISVIIIDDDDDDDNVNPVIPVAGSRGACGLAPDPAAALAMAPAPAVVVATPTPTPHAAATSVNTEGAPATASTTVVAIPPTPSAAAATITGAPLVTAVSVATQTAPDLAKGNNGFGQAGARYRYGGNGKVVARNNNSCGKSLSGHGNVDYGKGVVGYSDAGYGGRGVAGCSSGTRTYNTSTAARGESNKGCGKVYNCPVCKNTSFSTPQALGGHITSHHRIVEKKGKGKIDLQSGPHKCKVCNHVCQTGQELNFHMMSVHPHPGVVVADSAKEKIFEATGINNIGAAVNGPDNTMCWRFPTGASRSAILTLLESLAPVHQPPQGNMAMVGNPVTGHFSAANTSTGWSLPASSILPAIPLLNQELNPPEQIAAVVLGNHGHHSINPALFSNPLEEIAVVPSNAIASSSSTPHPGHSEAIGINNYSAAIDAPANTMGRRLPFFLAGRSDIHAFPVSRPVHHPTPGMAMDGNPLTSHFPAAISATGWSFPATTSSVLPAIPLQNPPEQVSAAAHGNHGRRNTNPLEEITVVPSSAIEALTNAMRRLPFFPIGRSAINGPPVSMPVHQPTQVMAAMAGNPVTGHFPAAMSANGCSFPETTSSILPAIPLRIQELNPPQGRLVPANGEHPSTFPTFPSQNQVEYAAEETVPGNNGGSTIRLFGKIIVEGQKEVKEPKK